MKEFVIDKWVCLNHNMHIILQSFNHMYIYNSLLRRSMISFALRDNLVSFTQVVYFDNCFLILISLKVPLILQNVLSALFSPSHYLLSFFSKEYAQSTLLSVAQSLKFQVSLNQLVRQFEREVERSHAFVEKIIYCKSAPGGEIQKKLKCF